MLYLIAIQLNYVLFKCLIFTLVLTGNIYIYILKIYVTRTEAIFPAGTYDIYLQMLDINNLLDL